VGFIENGELAFAQHTRLYIGRVINYHNNIATIPQNVYMNYQGQRLRIDSELLDDGMIGANYRFKTRAQLTRLYNGFRIPAVILVPDVGYWYYTFSVVLVLWSG
jgi:hypothetical protein